MSPFPCCCKPRRIAEHVYTAVSNDVRKWRVAPAMEVVWSALQTYCDVTSVAPDGSLYVGGSSAPGYATLRKYDAAGDVAWTELIHSAGAITSVAAAPGGSVVIGTFFGGVRKHGVSGAQSWSYPAGQTQDVAVDSSGDVYAALTSGSVIKISSGGTLMWSTPLGSAVNRVAIGTGGHAYAATDANTVAILDASGSQTGSIPVSSRATAVAIDKSDHRYIGLFNGDIIKLDSSGNDLWTFNAGGSRVWSIAVSPSGNVYALNSGTTLYSRSPSGGHIFSGYIGLGSRPTVSVSPGTYGAFPDSW